MKEILAVLLIASLTFSPNQALFPVGERAVVIRIDDVQDYGEPSLYARPEKVLLQYHIEHGIPAMLSIIPTRFGEDPQLVDQVKEGLARRIFTVAIHGWHHTSFINLSRSAQVSELQYGKNKLENILDASVLAFVPPYSEFNQDTIYAVRTNGLTLMSSSIYVGDIPRQEDGVAFLPQTVTTAAVVQNDTWALLPFESVTQEIKNSWDLYGVAVIVVHPRQLVGSGSEDRWLTYVNIIEWIAANQGSIIRFEPQTPETKKNIDPFLISVGIFAGLTSTLLIAFNVSAGRSNRKAKRITARSIEAADAAYRTYLNLGFSGLRTFTKITILCAGILCSGIVFLWWYSGKTYLDLGIPWLGFAYFGVGFFQGKIFYSSMITFLVAFALGSFILVEKQSAHPIKAILVSALVVLSGAYLFEYVYLFLNHQVLFKYLHQFSWWFNLAAGFVIGFGFKFMRITRRAVFFFSIFALSMTVWYLAGYPQLADKETPVLLYHNYLGIPVEYAFPLNVLSKFLACVSVVSLLKTEASPNPVVDLKAGEDAKNETASPEPNSEPAVKALASVLEDETADRSIRQAMLRTDSAGGQSSEKWNPASVAQGYSCGASLLPVVSCRRCGRRIARDDRHCDGCGLPTR